MLTKFSCMMLQSYARCQAAKQLSIADLKLLVAAKERAEAAAEAAAVPPEAAAEGLRKTD